MKRNDFIRQLGLLTGGVALGVQGMPVRAYAHNPLMLDMAGTNGNILVLVQLGGVTTDSTRWSRSRTTSTTKNAPPLLFRKIKY